MKKNCLIVDSGATKAHWALIKEKAVVKQFYTSGINVTYATRKDIEIIINEVVKQISKISTTEIDTIFFYGAGCSTSSKTQLLSEILDNSFKKAQIIIESDILGACHALCGDRPGWVAILGTGSASCLYDGNKIVVNTPSLGFLLGDEGSGTYLGKLLLTAYLRKKLPQLLHEHFEKYFNLNPQKVLENLYQKPAPNRFISSLAPFIDKYKNELPIYELCVENFDQFFNQNIQFYPDYANYKLNMVGSISFYFKDIIEKVAQKYKINIGTIEIEPMKNLILRYINS